MMARYEHVLLGERQVGNYQKEIGTNDPICCSDETMVPSYTPHL